MAEYIERGAAKYAVDLAMNLTDTEYDMICNQIDRLPAADVAPVRHANWLTWEEMFPGETQKKKSNLGVFCSACKNHADNKSNFCPSCGAATVTTGVS